MLVVVVFAGSQCIALPDGRYHYQGSVVCHSPNQMHEERHEVVLKIRTGPVPRCDFKLQLNNSQLASSQGVTNDDICEFRGCGYLRPKDKPILKTVECTSCTADPDTSRIFTSACGK
ncbi:Hypothetical predicted protein [Octopus vulgaris]|uniref:Uncharacterized protein n=1 Tax=Octopus vulgaris TaxID=6645 RepID=A0AA36FBI1_OCTVU|nr:Hypothetical predicted protein [Octopus vulgaris]